MLVLLGVRKCGSQIDLDQLAVVAELSDAQQGAGGGERGGKGRRRQPPPCRAQGGGIGAGHVDDRPHHVLRCRADGAQRGQGVGHDLVDLCVKVAVAGEGAVSIEGALAREVCGAASFHDGDVVISGSGVELLGIVLAAVRAPRGTHLPKIIGGPRLEVGPSRPELPAMEERLPRAQLVKDVHESCVSDQHRFGLEDHARNVARGRSRCVLRDRTKGGRGKPNGLQQAGR